MRQTLCVLRLRAAFSARPLHGNCSRSQLGSHPDPVLPVPDFSPVNSDCRTTPSPAGPRPVLPEWQWDRRGADRIGGMRGGGGPSGHFRRAGGSGCGGWWEEESSVRGGPGRQGLGGWDLGWRRGPGLGRDCDPGRAVAPCRDRAGSR